MPSPPSDHLKNNSMNISQVKNALEATIFASDDNLLPQRSLRNCVTHLLQKTQNLNKLDVNVTTGEMTKIEARKAKLAT